MTLYNISSKNKIIASCIVILLIVMLIFNAAVTPAHAVAFALTPAVIAVVGAALVACGFTFQNADQMSAVVQKCWDAIPDAAKTAFIKYADEYKAAREGGIGYIGYKISSTILSALKDWFTSAEIDVNNGVAITSGIDFEQTFSYEGVDLSGNLEDPSESFLSDIVSQGTIVGSVAGSPVYQFWYYSGAYQATSYLWFSAAYGQDLFPFSWTATHDNFYNYLNNGFLTSYYSISTRSTGSTSTTIINSSNSVTFKSSSYIGSYTISNFQIPSFVSWILSNGALVEDDVPCDVVYGPNSTDAKAAGLGTDVVVSGKMLDTSGTLDSDYVGTMTTAGVRDLAGAEAAADSTTLSGIKELVSTIATAVTTFFNPAEFSLDFDKLKTGFSDLSNVFPFCIPFDMYRGIKMFAASAADFSFDINLDTDLLTIDHTVDLTPFKVPIAFFRYIAVFWFSWILISRTRDLMKW